MRKVNKFEIAAELDTEEKRNSFLSQLIKEDLNNREMMDVIDTVKLSTENYPPELLLSKEWQKGYEYCKSRSQQKMYDLFELLLLNASTKLSAAAALDIGEYLIDELKDHALLTEKGSSVLIEKLLKQSHKLNAHQLAMYDPEMHPDSGEFINDGKDRLYFWSKKNLEKYPIDSV